MSYHTVRPNEVVAVDIGNGYEAGQAFIESSRLFRYSRNFNVIQSILSLFVAVVLLSIVLFQSNGPLSLILVTAPGLVVYCLRLWAAVKNHKYLLIFTGVAMVVMSILEMSRWVGFAIGSLIGPVVTFIQAYCLFKYDR